MKRMIDTDTEVYLSRLRFRLHVKAVPEEYYQHVGHPFINTPTGPILRPSLSYHHHTGL